MDLIDREQALKALEEISYTLWEVDIPSPTVPEYIEHHRDIQKVMGIANMWAKKIMALPPAERTGKWLDMGKFTDIDGNHHEVWKCDCCGYISHDDSNYCPNCGARMVSDEDKH